jgi:hypothetical protein
MISRVLVGSLLVCALGGLAAADDAARRREAKIRFEKGGRLYDEGRYTDALLAYQSAYEAFPSVTVLLNIGLVKEKVDDFEGCVVKLTQFLHEVPENDPARGKADARALPPCSQGAGEGDVAAGRRCGAG